MNKSELIIAVSTNSGISHKNARLVVNAFLESISNNISQGKEVRLLKFGRWYVKTRPSKKGYNIATKQIATIPSKRIVAFTPSKSLLEQNNIQQLEGIVKVVVNPESPIIKSHKSANNQPPSYKQGNSQKSNSKKSIQVPVFRSGNRIVTNAPNLGQRVKQTQTIESGDLIYDGKTSYYDGEFSDTENYAYPTIFIPFVNTPILQYRSKRSATGGVIEPVLSSALEEIREIEPQIEILQNISLPIKNRTYGYKPDIAIIWKEKNIFIDVEIDEPYDIVSRKPIHYKGCGDKLRNAYFLDNGWSVIRIAEKQIIDDCSKVVEYIKLCLSILSEDGRLNSKNEVERIERWSYSQAQAWAEEGYRESYLQIEKVEPITPINDDEDESESEYVGLVGKEIYNDVFIKPADDIISDRYSEIREQIKQVCKNGKYIKFTLKHKCYDYLASSNDISYSQQDGFYGVSFYDVIEKESIFLKFQEIESFEAEDRLYKYVASSEDDWNKLLFDAILDSNPVNIDYDTASQGSVLSRTILYPTLWYNFFNDEKLREYPSKTLLEIGGTQKYKTLAENPGVGYFTGFCKYRNDIRTFNIHRIKGGRIFNSRKNLHKITVANIWELLEAGYPDMAIRVYEELSEHGKKAPYHLGNYANALVMQGKFQKATDIYTSIDVDTIMPQSKTTWKEACLGDFDYFITNDIKKEEFEKIQAILKEKGW